MELIYETGEIRKVKVYKRDDGTYAVEETRTHNFDGFPEKIKHLEIFDTDGQHDGGPVVYHNLMYVYKDGDRPLKDRAIEYANRMAV